MCRQKCKRSILKESGITLLTLFVHWQLISKWTFVKPITLTCHWWICFVCFVFNLCSIWLQFEWCSSWKKILPTICHLLCNGQKLVFWGEGDLPLHYRFWSLCVKWLTKDDRCFCERGPSDSFVPNFVILDGTFVRLRMYPEKSLCKKM